MAVEEFAALARRTAPQVRAAGEDRVAAEYDSVAASHNARPAYWFGADALIAPPGYYDPALTNYGQYGLKVGMNLPVWDGGTRERERARSSLGAASAGAELARTSRDAGLDAAAAALNLVRLRELERIEEDASEWLTGLGTLVEAGVRAGTRGQADALRVALEQDVVTASLLSARQQLDEQRRELEALLGHPAGGVPPVREPDAGADRPPTPADSLSITLAAERAPEIREATLAAAAQQLSLLDAEHRNTPRLDIALDAGFFGSGLATWIPPDVRAGNPDANFGDRLRRDLGASFAFVFRAPLLDATAAPLNSAGTARVRASGYQLTTARIDQNRVALDLITRWRTAFERLQAAENAIHRAEDHVLRSKSLYAAGAISLIELLDARRLYDGARERLGDALFDCRVARFQAEARR
jgi:outer membrane protein TolC